MEKVSAIAERMRKHGMKTPVLTPEMKMENAEIRLKEMMTEFLKYENRKLEWLPEYEEVVQWLTSNQRRGLLLYGNCGRGKSILTRFVIPAMLLKYYDIVTATYDVQEMNNRIDEVLLNRFVAIDDVGTESEVNIFGNKRLAFSEVMDMAEKKGNIVIVSTNLNAKELEAKYGTRTMERLIATTKRIPFRGKSLRK